MLRFAVIAFVGCWTSSTPTPVEPAPQPTYSSARATAPAPTFPQTTPREAIESFLDAIDARRYDVVLRFIPAKYASTLTEDKIRDEFEGPSSAANRAIIDEIRAHLTMSDIIE